MDRSSRPGYSDGLLQVLGEWTEEDEAAEVAAFLRAEAARSDFVGTDPSLRDSSRDPGGAGSSSAAPYAVEFLEDEVEDLPACVIPPGYFRDRGGRWRYVDGGDLVPGAHDRTLARSWRFPRTQDAVLVPEALAGRGLQDAPVPELGWCARVARCRSDAPVPAAVHHPRQRRPVVSVWEVPLREWERRARVPLGLEAPELAVDALLDVAGVAALVGISAGTVRSYLHRGYLPAPVRTLGGSPVWSRAVVVRAMVRRPGQGRARAAS